MSTKITMSHGKDYHLYQEVFDNSNLYLKVEGHEFHSSNGEVMVQIPIDAWRTMIEDWSKRGWPKSEDHTEESVSNEWINSLERLLNSTKEP